MKNIFERYLDREPLIVDREVLRPNYIPDELPHREREIEELASILQIALRGERPSNVLIYGKTGTGKTAVVQFIGAEIKRFRERMGFDPNSVPPAEKVEEMIKQGSVEEERRAGGRQALGYADMNIASIRFIYINCQTVITNYGVLASIGNNFVRDWSELIPFTGWPLEKVYQKLRKNVDEGSGVTIVVLDEIDRLVYHAGDDVLYHLTDINRELKRSKLSIIGISNDLKFTEFLDPRVASRLGEERMTFPPYNATQLANILWQRAKLGLREGSFSEGVISKCAALAAEEHGDARKALDLLRVSAEMAEREGAGFINEEFVDRAQNNIEKDLITEVMRTLPIQAKVVLSGITIATRDAPPPVKLTTGEVYGIYSGLVEALGISHRLTQRRITDIISELDMLGLINARVINKGRYGRTREIELSSIPEEVLNTLLEEEALEPLKEIKLKDLPHLDLQKVL